jgi:hypothetical protein
LRRLVVYAGDGSCCVRLQYAVFGRWSHTGFPASLNNAIVSKIKTVYEAVLPLFGNWNWALLT